MPFLDQMFYKCILTMAIIVMVSLATCPTDDDPKGISLVADYFKTDRIFHLCAYAICIILVVIYTVF